jgi:hypothetical protein
MDLDLDTSWIEKEEKRFSIEMNYKKSFMDSISCFFIYIDQNLSIHKILKDEELLFSIDSNIGISNSRLLQIIQDHRYLDNGMKYKFMNLLKYNIDIDVERINEFTYGESDISYNFLKEVSIFTDILIEPSIFVFHPLNSLYFLFKEDIMVIKPIKSILKKGSDSNKSTKKVRIIEDSSNKSIKTRDSLVTKRKNTRKNLSS